MVNFFQSRKMHPNWKLYFQIFRKYLLLLNNEEMSNLKDFCKYRNGGIPQKRKLQVFLRCWKTAIFLDRNRVDAGTLLLVC